MSTQIVNVGGTGRLMITNNGDHPGESWAQIISEIVAPLGPDLVGERYRKAMELQFSIAKALEPICRAVQDDERKNLKERPELIAVDPEPSSYADDALVALRKATQGTPWEDHYLRNEVTATVHQELCRLLATIQFNAKSWHADRNPDHPASRKFRATYHPGAQ